jgi:hypothetical protein
VAPELVDHARAHAAAKRGGVAWKAPLSDHVGTTMPRDVDLRSPATVKRDWTRARAWLFRELSVVRDPSKGRA